MASAPLLSAADLDQLAAVGIERDEALGQIERLLAPPRPTRLLRPAILGDGIIRIPAARAGELRELARAARDAGRLAKFVPASGAATRMFRSLVALDRGDPELDLDAVRARGRAGDELAAEACEILERIGELALARPWARALGLDPERLAARARDGALAPLLEALLAPGGLDAASQPKALLPFHEVADGARTAFAEQLLEGIAYTRDAEGHCRSHFTIPPGCQELFEAALEAVRALAAARDARLEVDFSEQRPSTHTLALGPDRRPARLDDGTLLLRPAGHGALLANLGEYAESGADLVAIKNIDNILPERRHEEIAASKLLLVGLLVELEARLRELGRRLDAGALDGATLRAETAWARATLGRRPRVDPRSLGDDVLADLLADQLARPLRVCGVVPNTGEPGGGPFWTLRPNGTESLQIVESSQVDLHDDDQEKVWRSSTHFNPVDLAVALRDRHGRPHPLEGFVDPDAWFVATKSEAGRELTVLERPGLWNGAMAGWNTLFVEVPGATFAPVKTVLDLARPEHRAL